MGKIHRLKKDLKKRKNFNKKELRWQIKKGLQSDELISEDTRKLMDHFYRKRIANWEKSTTIHNRCIKTSRSRWVFRQLRLTRMQVSESFKKGDLIGFRKSSW